jgi:uncharacterized protein YkwD
MIALASLAAFVMFLKANAPLPTDKTWSYIQAYKTKTSKAYIYDQALCPYAKDRANDMYDEFSHRLFLDKTQHEVRGALQYKHLGENLISYSENEVLLNPQSLKYRWLESKSHRANLDSTKFTHSCLSCNDRYCVQLFAGY